MKKFFFTVIKAALIAGTLDILAAFTQAYIKNNTMPSQVLKSIAGGAFGKETFSSETTMVVWGLIFHFLIAFLFTLFFFIVVSRAPTLVSNPILSGIFYGIFVWATMRFFVLPYLSRLNPRPVVFKDAAIAAGILIICIGIPISYIARNYIRKSK